MIKLIDVGFGNINSLKSWLTVSSLKFDIVCDKQKFDKRDIILMPGVGAADFAMKRLKAFGILGGIEEHIEKGGKYIGICVGMQILYENLDEGPCKGLGVFSGKVELLGKKSNTLWSQLMLKKEDLHLNWHAGFKRKKQFKGRVFNNHSYGVVRPYEKSNEQVVMDSTQSFVQLVGNENVLGFQFHPEKSQKFGKNIAEFIGGSV